MSTDLTNVLIRIADFLGPIRNLLIVIFLASVVSLFVWIVYPGSEKLITLIAMALFWSFYLLMIEVGYGQGLSVGEWTYEGGEEIRSTAAWLQVYSALILIFFGLGLTLFTVDILFGPVR